MKELIEVNDKYEIEYRYSKKDIEYEDFKRMHSIALLERTKEGRKLVMRVDNCDKKTGLWPTHFHFSLITNNRLFTLFLGGSNESNWESLKYAFVMNAIAFIGFEYKEDLMKAMEKLKFIYDQK